MIIKDILTRNRLMRDSLSAKTNKVITCCHLTDLIRCVFTTPTYLWSLTQSALYKAYLQYHTHW